MSQLIYFAAPLFTEMEQRYNAYVVERIREQYGRRLTFTYRKRMKPLMISLGLLIR